MGNNKILVFDIESTSLMGKAFALGAVVLEVTSGKLLDSIQLKSVEHIGECVPWVQENVLPQLEGMPECQSDLELRSAFWDFYQKWKEEAEVWVDAGFPVETKFLMEVAMDDLAERELAMPFPLKDIANFLDVSKKRIELSGLQGLRVHHPLDDSIASAICIIDYFKK
jgi:hypothetical protein